MDEKGISASQLQKLALRYSEDARILPRAGRWHSAYYLAGYAVECGLKACIAKHIHRTVPSKKFIERFYGHKLDGLLDLAGAKAALQDHTDEAMKRNWSRIVSPWSSEVRYSIVVSLWRRRW